MYPRYEISVMVFYNFLWHIICNNVSVAGSLFNVFPSL